MHAFTGADMSTKLKLMGVDVASIGDAHGKTPRCKQLQLHRRAQAGSTRRSSSARRQAAARQRAGRQRSEYGTLLQMALNGIALPEDPEFLILPSSDGKAKPGLGADALPDSAQICSCNNVSKGR
jgi:nitrite reductase (NADH) large subunit